MTETVELILKARNGNDAAFEQIIRENSPLVWSIVKRFLGRGCDADDLYQLGCVGLIKAVHGFDESLGNQFSTYAVPKITGEIRRFLRDDGAVKVSRTLKENAAKIRRTATELCARFGREATLSELSAETGLTAEEIAQAECATAQTTSLDREITEDGQTLEELLGNHGLEDTTLEYITLSDAIEKLSQRERVVIMLRFFRCMTQQQAARVMGISQVQVSRIERAALKKLREYM
ncbi:MAG: sigma-70 family RNA polymerase sigma factor [Ruminococcaceae bacterium]|nr:sigma-70 family RNA polymerase sigma factor [Oscillospiraceae bacterium]